MQQVVMSYYNDKNSYNLYNCGATVRYMIPHFVLLGMIQQNWVKCAGYSDNYLYGMLQGQYYNDRVNVNLMFDTNEVKNSMPEARYKTSPESQFTISYSISKALTSVSECVICLPISIYGIPYRLCKSRNPIATTSVQDRIW